MLRSIKKNLQLDKDVQVDLIRNEQQKSKGYCMNGGPTDRLPIDKTYLLKYHVDEGKFQAGDKASNEGLTDALVLISILYPEDGSSSTMITSIDGRHTPVKGLSDADIFQAWSMMAHQLMQSKKLPEHFRLVCETAFETVREFVLAGGKDRN